MRLARRSQRPNLPWSFAVVDSPAVNAFALPGGFIYITRGILPYLDNEAQLVGVLGHEIGHVTARHSAQQYTRGMGASLGVLVGSIFVPQIRPFSDLAQGGTRRAVPQVRRDDELQADALGAEYAAGGGWDPGRSARVPDDARADFGSVGSQRRAQLDGDASRSRRIARSAWAMSVKKVRAGGDGTVDRRSRSAISRASTASSLATIPKTASSAAICSCIRRCGSRSNFPKAGRSPTATSRWSRRSRGTRCSWCCARSSRGRGARSIRSRSSTCASRDTRRPTSRRRRSAACRRSSARTKATRRASAR